MKIVRKQTGVDVVASADAGVVILDPELSHEEAVLAVGRVLPGTPVGEVIHALEMTPPSPEVRVHINRAALTGWCRTSSRKMVASVAAVAAALCIIASPRSALASDPFKEPLYVHLTSAMRASCATLDQDRQHCVVAGRRSQMFDIIASSGERWTTYSTQFATGSNRHNWMELRLFRTRVAREGWAGQSGGHVANLRSDMCWAVYGDREVVESAANVLHRFNQQYSSFIPSRCR